MMTTRTELRRRRSAMRQRIREVVAARRIALAQPAEDFEPEPTSAS